MAAPHQREVRAGADLRLLRAAVFAAVCVALSAGGHALASCATVPLWTLGAGFLAVFVVAAPLAGRTRTLPGIASALAVGQLALHTLFGLGQHGTQAASGALGHTAHTAHSAADAALIERAARLVCGAGAAALSPSQAHRILSDAGLSPSHSPGLSTGPSAGPSAGPSNGAEAAGQSGALLPDTPMVIGHLLAALAAGWLLRRGDLALLRLTELSMYGVEEGALVRSLRAALSLVRALLQGLPAGLGLPPQLPRTARRATPLPRTAVLDDTVIRRGPPAAGFSLAA